MFKFKWLINCSVMINEKNEIVSINFPVETEDYEFLKAIGKGKIINDMITMDMSYRLNGINYYRKKEGY